MQVGVSCVLLVCIRHQLPINILSCKAVCFRLSLSFTLANLQEIRVT